MIRKDFPFPLEIVSFYHPRLQRKCGHKCISKALHRLRNWKGRESKVYYLYNPKVRGWEGGISILRVSEVMELAVWPAFEDHLQTTTFISCTAVSDAKDDTSGGDTAYDATLGQKREDWSHEQDLRQAWFVSSKLLVHHSRWFRLPKVGSESWNLKLQTFYALQQGYSKV